MATDLEQATSVSLWSIDQTHSSIHFKVRHMMISWVRGEFRTFTGTLTFDQNDISRSKLEVDIDASSIHTRDDQRDQHLKSPDFLDVQQYPKIHFDSANISKESALGNLTIHGTTRQVTIDLDSVSPVAADPWGNSRMAASGRISLSRKDFGLSWNSALETGGVLVGDEVHIDLDVEFIKVVSK